MNKPDSTSNQSEKITSSTRTRKLRKTSTKKGDRKTATKQQNNKISSSIGKYKSTKSTLPIKDFSKSNIEKNLIKQKGDKVSNTYKLEEMILISDNEKEKEERNSKINKSTMTNDNNNPTKQHHHLEDLLTPPASPFKLRIYNPDYPYNYISKDDKDDWKLYLEFYDDDCICLN